MSGAEELRRSPEVPQMSHSEGNHPLSWDQILRPLLNLLIVALTKIDYQRQIYLWSTSPSCSSVCFLLQVAATQQQPETVFVLLMTSLREMYWECPLQIRLSPTQRPHPIWTLICRRVRRSVLGLQGLHCLLQRWVPTVKGTQC